MPARALRGLLRSLSRSAFTVLRRDQTDRGDVQHRCRKLGPLERSPDGMRSRPATDVQQHSVTGKVEQLRLSQRRRQTSTVHGSGFGRDGVQPGPLRYFMVNAGGLHPARDSLSPATVTSASSRARAAPAERSPGVAAR